MIIYIHRIHIIYGPMADSLLSYLVLRDFPCPIRAQRVLSIESSMTKVGAWPVIKTMGIHHLR